MSGALAIVLHTHMPYVEGHGRWPFGEEWLWEAVATCYLPLLDVLDAAPGRVTLSVTPVLGDQLEAPGALERCAAFLREIRPESHRRDIAAAGDRAVVAALEHSARAYERAADALEREAAGHEGVAAGHEGVAAGHEGVAAGHEGVAAGHEGVAARHEGVAAGHEGVAAGHEGVAPRREGVAAGLAARLAAHATWTSAATHAILPLLATAGGVRLQLETGIAAHRARSGAWGGGLWLPECAHAPWLDPLLEEAGVRATCVDLTDVLGRGDVATLRPLRSPAGPLLVPLDRALLELVWSAGGYPSHGDYRDTHRLTEHHHQAWAVGGAPYDAERGAAQARSDAEDFVASAAARVADGGIAAVALDTELLGVHWHEGVGWLAEVLAAADRANLRIAPLDDLLDETEPAPAPPLPVTSWGTPRDLSTWSGPAAGGLAWRQRAAELRALSAAPDVPERALRELLALQSSDWAFLIAHGTAGDYPRERAAAHEAAFDAALAAPGENAPELRNLAPYLARRALAEP